MLLLGAAAVPAYAKDAADSATETSKDDPNRAIVVTAPPLFQDVRPERELDPEGVASYGDSTVGDLLGDILGELDDDEEPLIFVNGQRINDPGEVAGLPAEVLRNVRVLPRGSAVRAGGAPGQRVISLTLTRRARTATLTAASKIATEGDWRSSRGEGILTDIRGNTRANLTLRVRDESALLESDRGIIQPQPRLPFSIAGNVIGFPDTLSEVDQLLSDAAGQVVTVTPIPPTATPALADFVAGANQASVTDLGQFRTLRPDTRIYDLNGTFSTRLAPWLTSTATIQLSRNNGRALRGLPSAIFILSPDNPFSPFSTDVGLAVLGKDPLESRSRSDNGQANLTLDANFGAWTANLNARHSVFRNVSTIDVPAAFNPIPIADNFDPFGTDLTGLIPVRADRVSSRSGADLALLSATGPALSLPAGPLQATFEGRVAWNRLESRSDFSGAPQAQSFRRSEQSFRAAADVPLTSRDNGFLAQLGDLDATGEYTRLHFSDAGTLNHYAFGLTWEPRRLLRLEGDLEASDAPASIQVLGNPVIITPNVRVFDPLTGTTVDVVQISGGNPSLFPEQTRIRRLSGLLRLVPRLNLQLNGEYTDTDVRHFLSSLPDASAAVMLAFPDRFVRDANGVLTTVDLRPVNFDSHREKRFRYGFSLNSSIGGHGETRPARRSHSSPATRLQLTVNDTLVFQDEIRIRPGLGSVNLLEGGAIGIAGGRVRHQLDGTAAVTSGGLGARIGVAWRGRSALESRLGGDIDTLRFSPLLSVNVRAFADAARLLPHERWAETLRLSLNVLNLTDDHQAVRDSRGNTPLQYQPAIRDPIGRTVELELRKVL